jgi:hypothetical protein
MIARGIVFENDNYDLGLFEIESMQMFELYKLDENVLLL